MNSARLQQPSRLPRGRTRTPARASAARPSAAGGPLGKAELRLLSALAEEGVVAMPDPTREGSVILRGEAGGISLGRGSHALADALDLVSRDLLAATGRSGARRFAITEVGRAHLRRRAAGPDGFRAQQQERVSQHVHDGTGPAHVTVNAAENPLDWLRRRRDASGEPLIDAACHVAGERLRRDLTFAAMLPSVTARWEGAIGGGGAHDPAGASDSVIAARQRVHAALAAVGSDYADLLVDLCGFLKGLELIERERRWPPRSAKVVVRLALRRLAEHYRLTPEATGPAHARGIRTWREGLPEMG
jgi:hypothetical protein